MHRNLKQIGLTVPYDMGSQKRAAGNIYNSLSGHGFFIGCRTKNVVLFGYMKKKCSMCGQLD